MQKNMAHLVGLTRAATAYQLFELCHTGEQ